MKLRHLLPLTLTTALAGSGTALLLTMPGDAAEPELSYAAEAAGELLRIHQLDLDMSGDPVALDLAAGRVAGLVAVDAQPRSRAEAANLAGKSATGAKTALSHATASEDTTAATTAAGAAGVVPGTLEYGASALSARARWTGDDSCVPADAALTTSRAVSDTVALPAAEIPTGDSPLDLIPLPTTLPTEIPTSLPTGFPTGLPTDLPTILPTGTDLPTILPTGTGLPTVLPSITILPAPAGRDAAGEPVSMMRAARATLEERTGLRAAGIGLPEGVTAEVSGTLAAPAAPALAFFGGEVTVTMTGAPTLTAYSPGTAAGSAVDYDAADLTVTAGGTTVDVPADGGAVAVPWSGNEDVVLYLARGAVQTAEDPTGRIAQADVSALDILVKHGDAVVLRAEFLPMEVRTVAPDGGVVCPRDTDGDKLLDTEELATHGTDPEKRDTDGDRLTDGREVLKLRTNPLRKDTDRDRLNDRVEVKKYKTNPRRKDTDRDRLNDRVEVKKYQTNPRRKDTDRDGVSDYREIKRGTDPLKR